MKNPLLSLIVAIVLSGCSIDCDYQQQVDYVEALSQERLFQLYNEIASLSQNSEKFGEMLKSSDVSEAEKELSTMPFNFIRLNRKRADLMLGGCVDDKAYLHFEGFNESSKSIVLTSGEHFAFKKIVLWEKSK